MLCTSLADMRGQQACVCAVLIAGWYARDESQVAGKMRLGILEKRQYGNAV
jgi:hypothetical protein